MNDCWNANPMSMRAALEDLVDRAAGRRTVAVLGEMAELGPTRIAYHREIGQARRRPRHRRARRRRRARAAVRRGRATAWPWPRLPSDAKEAAGSLREASLAPGDCVLVKGSRAVGLEVVAAALADGSVD